MLPRSGDVLHVTKAESVQFTASMLFRVIPVHDWPTYDGWIWLDGYERSWAGGAEEEQSMSVQVGGVRRVGKPPGPGPRSARRPVDAPGSAPAHAVRTSR